jgi:hypothetical protein
MFGMRIQVLFFLLTCSAWGAKLPPVEGAPEVLGSIYPVDQFPERCGDLLRGVECKETPFGRYKMTTRMDGEWTETVTTFSGPEGVQVTDRSWERDGRVKRAVIENLAIRKRSEIEVREGKAYYKNTDLSDGSVKTSVDEAEENLVVPSTVFPYLKPRFRELKEGKEIRLKVAVLDRLESFTFTVRRIRQDRSPGGEEILVLEMVPVSFIVKALVDPMYFYVKSEKMVLFAYEGRSALRRKRDGSYKEMKVRTAYEYPQMKSQARVQ